MLQELYHKLLSDLRRVGISIDFNLELKPYSKTYYGRYDPNSNKVTVYVYEDSACTRMQNYKDLLLTLIHESIHCIQWNSESFVRVKGVMHDVEFYRLYNLYSQKAEALLERRESSYIDIRVTKPVYRSSEIHC